MDDSWDDGSYVGQNVPENGNRKMPYPLSKTNFYVFILFN